MNPSELKLLSNLNDQLDSVRKALSTQAQQFDVLKDSYVKEIKLLDAKFETLTQTVELTFEALTPYVAKVVLPEHMRTLPQQSVHDVVDGVMSTTAIRNPYPVKHGDEVLVLSAISNKDDMCVVSNEVGRLIWPLPLSLFEKLE
jgi:hypothetical protein